MEHAPILPILHLNGTSRKELIQVRRDAAYAVHNAIDSLCAMSPNGRDYYPVRGLFDQAADQHARRLAMLDGIYNEIVAEVMALSDADPLPGDA